MVTLLDAGCCAGGMTRGYQRAGFRVTGVDIEPQPDYIGDDFVQADAAEFIHEHGHKFDLISGSPPCQDGTCTVRGNRTRGLADDHVNLIPSWRDAMLSTGRPFVIENTPGNKMRLHRPIMLCGEYFGLGVIRHRYFELNGWSVRPIPNHPKHRGRVRGWRHGEYFDGPYVAVYGSGGGKATVDEAQVAMGIFWVFDLEKLNEAIPPAYAQWIGEQWLSQR